MIDKALTAPLTRRQVLGAARIGVIAAAGVGLAPSLASSSAKTASDVLGILSDLGALPETGRIRITAPRVYKDGRSVPLAIEVDSPMTEVDHVRQIHVVAPGNPIPEVASFHFTPLGGKASASTRIRLAAGNRPVLAVAELNDGSLLMTKTSVRVTNGGCTN